MTDRDADLDALEALALKATPGPFMLSRYQHGGGRMYLSRVPAGMTTEDRTLIADFYDEANREFYAACSPDAILALVRRVREVEAKVTAAHRERDQALSKVAAMARTNPGSSGGKTAAGVYHERAERAEAAAAGMRAAGERLIGAIEACAIAERGGPPVNWQAVDASQDSMRGALADPTGARVAAVVSAAEAETDYESTRPSSGDAADLGITARLAVQRRVAVATLRAARGSDAV